MRYGRRLCFLVMMLISILLISACGSGSDLNQVIGGYNIAETELTTEQIEETNASSLTQKYQSEIASIIRGEEKYEKLHDELVENLRFIIEDEDNQGWAISGESRVYVSVVPLLGWSVDDNEVYCTGIVVFSEDMQSVFQCNLNYVNGNYSWSNMSDFEDSKLLRRLIANPDREYVRIADGNVGFWLGEGNEIIEGGLSADGITVSDDYYEKICGFGLGISYDKLTAEENLVAFDFDE